MAEFLGILIPIGVKHLLEAELISRRKIEVRCSVLERTVLSVAVFTVESADSAQLTFSVMVIVGKR